MKTRIKWLDLTKGITIFLVVIVHVIEGIYKTGKFPQYDGFSQFIMGILFTIVMPVFFALSGYTYRPINTFKKYGQSLYKKIISLGIPYIIFSIIYVCLQHVDQHVHQFNTWRDLMTIYTIPIGYLWFLYVLFFIYVLIGLMDISGVPALAQLVIYAIMFGYYIVTQANIPYGVSGLCMWTICFYIGYLIKYYSKILLHKTVIVISLMSIILSIVWQMVFISNWFNTNMMTKYDFVAKLASIVLFLPIFAHLKENNITNYFSKYGYYSLIIYLVHAPIASIARIIMLKVGISNYAILALLTLVISWYVSIGVIYVTTKNVYINMLFYPFQNLRKYGSQHN